MDDKLLAVIEQARAEAIARNKGLNRLSLESRIGRAIVQAIRKHRGSA